MKILEKDLKTIVRVSKFSAKNDSGSELMSMSSSNGKLVVTCSDGQISARASMDSDTDFGISVNASRLASFCGAARADVSVVLGDESKASFKAGRSRLTLPFAHHEEVDRFAPVSMSEFSGVPGDALCQALSSVSPSAGKNDSRPMLNGVFFAMERDTLTVRASNGSIASVSSVKLMKEAKNNFFAIVPNKGALEIARMAKTGPIGLYADQHEIIARQGKSEIRSKLISGCYPSFDKMFIDFDCHVTIPRQSMLDALSRVGITAEEDLSKWRASRIIIEAIETEFKVSSRSNGGETNDSFEVAFMEHPFIRELDPKLIEPIIRVSAYDSFVIGYRSNSDSNEQIIITSGSESKHVVMPLRKS